MDKYTKNELLVEINEYKKMHVVRGYSRMRKAELQNVIKKPYCEIAELKVSDLRRLCREKNKQNNILTSKAKKQDLIENMDKRGVKPFSLPRAILGDDKVVDIIVANLIRQRGFTQQEAREYYILRTRKQMGEITEEQLNRMKYLSNKY